MPAISSSISIMPARPGVLETMGRNGHEPCVVVQTGLGHLQAWVRVSTTCLQPELATALGRQLAHAYRGDLASTDWRYLGRLAGFRKHKLQRRTAREGSGGAMLRADAAVCSMRHHSRSCRSTCCW